MRKVPCGFLPHAAGGPGLAGPQDTDTFRQVDGLMLDLVADAGWDVTRQRGEAGVFGSIFSGEAARFASYPSPANLAPAGGLAIPRPDVAR